MVRKRLDDRIRTLLERSIANNHRSFLVIVGDHGKNQVPNIYQVLSKTRVSTRLKVLWCYKKELGFSTHRMKRMKKIQRDKARGLVSSENAADSFELFLSQTDITWCYYKDSHRILGTTHDILVLQDFSAITPNVLARTIETVAAGGTVILLLRSVTSLSQLYRLAMDVHSRYRTESAGDLVPRFNERFILSLATCSNCLVCDEELNVLPLSKKVLKKLEQDHKTHHPKEGEEHVSPVINQELIDLKEQVVDAPYVGALVGLTATVDQAQAVFQFLDACTDRQAAVVALTAARGRGKSAALGLCLAGAVALGYSQIAVTAPEPENLVSVFQFCLSGLKALAYQEQIDYTIQYNNAAGRDAVKCVMSIRLHRSHRQVIQYIRPSEKDKFASAEIVAIDEAAAIPLPTVRALLTQQSDRLCFLSSTVNGYEGTGRALSLKLIQELRNAKGAANLSAAAAAAGAVEKRSPSIGKRDAAVHETRYAAAAEAAASSSNTRLREVELKTPIRYAEGDPIEKWLNKLLCLDSASSWKLQGGAPAPADCELYSVDRDALFSFHKLSEAFLQKLMGLYTSAHYKNTPNDLQMLSDAPAHALFVLLSPAAEQDSNSLPDVLAVVQVALEGRISRKAVEAQLARGHRSAGDLIPWTISQQFGDSAFAQLSGARIVRVAVHPTVQGMGYGSRAMELLYRYYNGEMVSLVNPDLSPEDEEEQDQPQQESDEDDDDDSISSAKGLLGERVKPRKQLPPLLLPLTEVEAPRLDWIGTSFGLTLRLHKFWASSGMRLLYLRQTKNELTGEHSAIMLRALPKPSGVKKSWLASYASDTRRRLVTLLAGCFRDMPVRLSISLLENLEVRDEVDAARSPTGKLTADELDVVVTPHDRKRLELYGRNLCDYHLVTDLLPIISRLYFLGRLGNMNVSSVQAALLCGVGLQTKTVDSLVQELGLPANQVLAMFNKTVRKISILLNDTVREREKKAMLGGEERQKAEKVLEKMQDVTEKTLAEDTKDSAKDAADALRSSVNDVLPPEITEDPELMQYVVKGSKEDWDKALEERELRAGEVLVKSGEKRKTPEPATKEKPQSKSKKSSGKKKKNKRKQ